LKFDVGEWRVKGGEWEGVKRIGLFSSKRMEIVDWFGILGNLNKEAL